MNKRIAKELKKIANDLPAAIEKRDVIKKGSQLLAKDPKALDEKGLPIVPSKLYTIEEVNEVDHWKNIKSRYKTHGLSGVNDYKDDVIEYYKTENNLK